MQAIIRQLAGLIVGAALAVGIMTVIGAMAHDATQSPQAATSAVISTVTPAAQQQTPEEPRQRSSAEPTGEPSDQPSDQTSDALSDPVNVNTIDAGAAHYINYQGQLFDPNTNEPLANTGVNVGFRLYGDINATQEIWRENKFILTNVDGVFNTNLGDVVPFDLSIFDGRELYLGIAINNELTEPVQRITYTVYSFWSRRADSLGTYGERDFPKMVAYGVVDGDGDRNSGYNFDSSRRLVEGELVYIIDIPGISHSINDFTTNVTPACVRPVMFGVGTSNGDLIVDMWDEDGNRTECRFEFMVMRRRN